MKIVLHLIIIITPIPAQCWLYSLAVLRFFEIPVLPDSKGLPLLSLFHTFMNDFIYSSPSPFVLISILLLPFEIHIHSFNHSFARSFIHSFTRCYRSSVPSTRMVLKSIYNTSIRAFGPAERASLFGLVSKYTARAGKEMRNKRKTQRNLCTDNDRKKRARENEWEKRKKPVKGQEKNDKKINDRKETKKIPAKERGENRRNRPLCLSLTEINSYRPKEGGSRSIR